MLRRNLQSHNTRHGFTLIELSFAIAFLSVLLITVTLITNEIISTYRKGYAMKSVNQVGRSLIEDFTDAVTNSPTASPASLCQSKYSSGTAYNHCVDDGGFKFVYQQYYSNQITNRSDTSFGQVPIGGVFCTGKYSYAWNTGYVLGKDDFYKNSSGGSVASLRLNIGGAQPYLYKFEDTTRAVCANNLEDSSYAIRDNSGALAGVSPPKVGGVYGFDIPSGATLITDFLKDSDTPLALYDLVVFPPARVEATNRLLYTASFILGTTNGSVNIMSASDFCEAPNGYNDIDFSYCAVNKFNFSTQATGSSF